MHWSISINDLLTSLKFGVIFTAGCSLQQWQTACAKMGKTKYRVMASVRVMASCQNLPQQQINDYQLINLFIN